MRDVLLVSLVLVLAVVALRRPWVGVLLWTWLSLMNPHRYTYGFAFDAPLAALAAASTLLGFILTTDRRESPFKGAPTVLLALFTLWVTLSWLLGLDWQGDYPQWDKVMKINFMLFVALALLHSKKHILSLMWVCALSIALLGLKGGVFTVATLGSYRTWGPPGSFISDNNAFATALVMTIPLLRFLQLQLTNRKGRHAMSALMILVAVAALGSHSRGGLLAIAAMTALLWWRGRNRFVGGITLLLVGVTLVAFMPDQWSDRMATINTFEEDESAMGRIAAWWVAWGIAKDYPFGVGFNSAREFLFQAYSPIQLEWTPVAHSIYFQVLGHHGFVGLALFLALWITTFRWAGKLRKEAAGVPEARWCIDLANMCQVSLLAYAVGGAFLDLAYFDLPYNIMVMIVLTRVWVRRRAWLTEPMPSASARWVVPGLRGPMATA